MQVSILAHVYKETRIGVTSLSVAGQGVITTCNIDDLTVFFSDPERLREFRDKINVRLCEIEASERAERFDASEDLREF